MSKFDWQVLDRGYEDVIYETYNGIAKITINRPEIRNAFRPKTVVELIDAFTIARDDTEVGVIILTGANHGGDVGIQVKPVEILGRHCLEKQVAMDVAGHPALGHPLDELPVGLGIAHAHTGG